MSVLTTEPVEQLLAVAQALMSASDPDEVLGTVIDVAIKVFDAEACSLSLYDRGPDQLEFFVSQGAAKVAPFRMPAGQGIAGHVFQTGEAYRSNDVSSDLRFYSGVDRKSGHNTRSMLCCPLSRRGERTGTIQVLNTRREHGFSESDGKLLGVLAGMAAVALDRARAEREMRSSHEVLREEVADRNSLVMGKSKVMARELSTLERAAASHTNVLLLGESGVGKEVAARAVHRWSERRERAFVVINCAALSPQLLESDLFGHERGAFTGAVAKKRGKFELADRGTLFLDEIGELALDLQAKLLRVLQDGEMQRVGGTETLRPNVRIVAATNRDLAQEVEAGRFRLDLFYRLRVIAVTLPALRERREDIPELALHFLTRAAREQSRRVVRFHPDALEKLCAHDWPGNVRELANVIERAVVLCPGEEVGLDDLPNEVLERSLLAQPAAEEPPTLGSIPNTPLADTLAGLKRQVIRATLEHYDGNQARAAAHLGLHPSNLSRALKQLGLR